MCSFFLPIFGLSIISIFIKKKFRVDYLVTWRDA
jgi:hypothetical protein